MQTIETSSGRLYVKDGIMRLDLKDNARIDLPEAIEIVDAQVETVGSGPRLPLLVDFRTTKHMGSDAREHFLGEVSLNTLTKVVLWVKSPISKLIGNFFLGLSRQRVNLRLFTNEDEAIQWLREK